MSTEPKPNDDAQRRAGRHPQPSSLDSKKAHKAPTEPVKTDAPRDTQEAPAPNP
jgi:hypothetical protein